VSYSVKHQRNHHDILVTAYSNPDLDGTACMIAYAEFLQKDGYSATAVLCGVPHREAQFVFETFNIVFPEDADSFLIKDAQVVLVDASDVNGISNAIHPLQVIELIDHRKINQADRFPNAKIQIELVGAAATLIAEKFASYHIDISPHSAALLYSAIISNTVNFQAGVTTGRDKKMAGWLLKKFKRPRDYIHRMFTYKSTLTQPIAEIIEQDFATFDFNHRKVGIGQLEILHVDEFIKSHSINIEKALVKIKKKKLLDIIFLSTIDVEKANTTFIIVDNVSKELLEKTLRISFKKGIAQKKGILMRKSIVHLLKQSLAETTQ